MGKGGVELPDPSDIEKTAPVAASAPVKSGPAPSADDLLSQLAGNEIDRLLAEADVDRGGPETQKEGGTGSGKAGGDKPWKAALSPELAASARAKPGMDAPAETVNVSSLQEEIGAEL